MMLQNPNPNSLDAHDIEPWLTFLVERLSQHWPWVRSATPGQLEALAGGLSDLLERMIARNSLQVLHVEIERDPVTIAEEVDEVIHTMKPERVQ